MKRSLAVAAAVAFASLLAAQPAAPPVLQPKPATGGPATAKTVKPDFELKLERKSNEPARTLANEEETRTSERAYYTVNLRLLGPENLNAATLEYRVFYSPPVGENAIVTPPLQKQSGSVNLGAMKVGDTNTFDTPAFEVPRGTQKGAWVYYADGGRTRFKADLAGVWVRVSIGGVVVFERAEPESIKGKAEF
ncbi:MAG: hypothetical protein JSR82_20950 [Verrucomicrobia bacterium]|nr:hypothetical protein [Verrucomicrobiota bacterium]